MSGGGGYREIAPPAPLRPFVECFWTVQATGGAAARTVLPDGCIDLLVDRLDGSAWLIGAMTQPLSLPPVPTMSIAAVRFRPGGAAAFLGGDLAGFTDGRAELGALGRWQQALAHRALDAGDESAAAAALAAGLLRRLPTACGDAIDRVLHELEGCAGAMRIDVAAATAGVSRQHFARQVRRRTGLSPKQLAGILRCRRAVALLRAGRAPAAVAAHCGYADQSHLTRAVRACTGAPPTHFLA